MNDYRYDPFNDVSEAITITNEIQTIPSNSPYSIRLFEVPLLESPSSMEIMIRDILTADISSSSQAYMYAKHGPWFSVGDVVQIDNEQVYVSAVSGESAASTLGADVSSTTATSITVGASTILTGSVILVDSEQMLVTAGGSTTMTVTRGYNGTTAATHSSGASVYVENLLTITRGYNSTTATTHTAADSSVDYDGCTHVLILDSMTEVAATPTAGQFWPDYTTQADDDEDWNTGTVLFHEDDAGKDVAVAYLGTGSLVDTRALARVKEVFTSSGTYTVPAGITKLYLTGCGGGGGGGGTLSTGLGGGGGGGATCCIKTAVTVVPGKTYTVTIGAGGSGVSGNSGTSGGATSFGSLLTLAGGGYGVYGGASPTVGTGGTGGTYSQSGMAGNAPSLLIGETTYYLNSGGKGGNSLFGAGGQLPGVTLDNTAGVAGNGFGAGGSGSRSASGGTTTGGSGSGGLLIIEG